VSRTSAAPPEVNLTVDGFGFGVGVEVSVVPIHTVAQSTSVVHAYGFSEGDGEAVAFFDGEYISGTFGYSHNEASVMRFNVDCDIGDQAKAQATARSVRRLSESAGYVRRGFDRDKHLTL
jgi:hypothetical protein